jgi:2-polyprenyl-3-methyl-5-hydroxy-6-metoxy-1,4-benzoquinol methylase
MDQQQYISNLRPEMLKYLPEHSTKVMEMGCGDGTFASSMMKDGREVWGIEMDQKRAAIAKPKITKLIEGDLVDLISTIPTNYFDCIFFNDVLEHLLEPGDVLQKIIPLLKKDGLVISSIPNFRYVGNLQEILLQKDFRYKTSGILDKTHFRFFTQKSIIRMFNEAGFDVIKTEGIRPTYSWKVKLFSNLSFGLFSDIRFLQFATVAKPKFHE